ncbi:MAG: cupredoxin domain-containing protein [Acidimicrobiia bacterium]
MKRVLIMVTALALTIGACSSDDAGPTTSAGVVEERVEIADFAFSPETLTIAVGTTVTWVNNDAGLAHTSTSTDDVWTSGTLNEGDEFSVPFDEPGTFTYFCTVHPTMTGSIIVEA